jgi:hypothetical protein
MIGWGAAWWLASGCGHPVPPEPFLPFRFEARTTAGEVRVVPALRLHAPLTPVMGSALGSPVPYDQRHLRLLRTAQLGHLSEEVGIALPAEVNGQLGDRWRGQFHTGGYPWGVRRQLREALRSGREVDRALGEAAKAIGGDAALITWVDGVDASPLTLTEWPGLVVETAAGPIVVDAQDEPYVVRAQIGMALVAADGEVILRYHDTYETVLSGARGPSEAARDLAYLVAREVAHMWVVDPRLYEVDPGVAEAEERTRWSAWGTTLSFR